MGTPKRMVYTIPLPTGAKVNGDTVTWTAKGKTKAGRLSPDTGRVLVHSVTWTARYKDENDKTVEVSTKCKDRAAATRFLVKLENDVAKIRAGAIPHRDIDVTEATGESLQKHLDDFFVSQSAKGVGRRQIDDDKSKLLRLFSETDICELTDIAKRKLDQWIVDCREGTIIDPVKKRNRWPRTINSYIVCLRTFCKWCVTEKRLRDDPTVSIGNLNVEVDKRRHFVTEYSHVISRE